MGRRVIYLREILQKKNTELVRQIFDIMLLCPSKYDWIKLIENDLNQLDIQFSEEVIKSYTKDRFKAVVKKKINSLAHKFLIERKTSKLMNLHNYSFQEYLSSNDLTLKQKRLLFQFRIRMVNSIRDNFKNHFKNNMLCPLDNNHYDDQPSLLLCPVILANEDLKAMIQGISYTDIFKSIEYQVPAIKVLEKIIIFRNMKLRQMESLEVT